MFSPSVASLYHPPPTVLRLILCVVLVVLPIPILAQQPQDDEVIRVSTDLSVFPIRVRTRNRHLPGTITANNFQLKDTDGVTTSFYFAAGSERVAIVFALDESGSLGQILSQQKEAALALFDRFGQNSRVGVLRFSRQPLIVFPLGNDSAGARTAFEFRARRNTPTAIFDAANSAVRMFENVTRDPAERRIVILISDGLDNASTAKVADIINDARTKNISFYTIQVPLFEPRDGHLVVREASKGFKDLAEKTGGKYFLTANASSALSSDKSQDLSSVFRDIEEDLKSQYVVGFYVSEKARDDRTHRVSIVLTDPSVEYSVAQYGFSRTHYFSIRLPRLATND
jgi:Ca-activated chloride channel family protein